MDEITKQLAKLSQARPVDAIFIPLLREEDHQTVDCQALEPVKNVEVKLVDYMKHPRQEVNDPFAPTYNKGWRNHPAFSWANNQDQPTQTHTQQQFPQATQNQRESNQLQPTLTFAQPTQKAFATSDLVMSSLVTQMDEITNQLEKMHKPQPVALASSAPPLLCCNFYGDAHRTIDCHATEPVPTVEVELVDCGNHQRQPEDGPLASNPTRGYQNLRYAWAPDKRPNDPQPQNQHQHYSIEPGQPQHAQPTPESSQPAHAYSKLLPSYM
ncbi:hypothetical protein M5689_020915 [Euphorbia peplus]|nr:hypothetical protein M5689_020915 [Euphorbia peplus]